MTTKGEWKKFTGATYEIDEINNSKKFQLRRGDMDSCVLVPPLSTDRQVWEMELECTEFYRIVEK